MSRPPPVWVLDSSAIISVKQLFPRPYWQAVFDALTALLDQGLLSYPKKVVEELGRYAHQDLPLQWAKSNFGKINVPNPPDSAVREVMAQAGDVVDPDKEHEDGDPYVLAQAVHLRQSGYEVTVVTDEREDQPTHISMRTACQRLRLPYVTPREFLQRHGIRL